MFVNSTMAAEMEYRTNRIREDWKPRRRGLRLPRQRRRLYAGHRPGAVGTVVAAR